MPATRPYRSRSPIWAVAAAGANISAIDQRTTCGAAACSARSTAPRSFSAGLRTAARRTSKTGSRPARRRWSTGSVQDDGWTGEGGVPAVGYSAGHADPGHRVHRAQGELAPYRPYHGRLIYYRLLGEKGYFDTRIAYISATGPRERRTRRLAIMDQDSENQRLLTDGSWMVLTPRFHPKARPDRLHELCQQSPARLPVRLSDRRANVTRAVRYG